MANQPWFATKEDCVSSIVAFGSVSLLLGAKCIKEEIQPAFFHPPLSRRTHVVCDGDLVVYVMVRGLGWWEWCELIWVRSRWLYNGVDARANCSQQRCKEAVVAGVATGMGC